MSHPLGEYVLDRGRRLDTAATTLAFDYSNHPLKISVFDNLESRSGWLSLNVLWLESFQEQEHMVFTAVDDNNAAIDFEACERLFDLPATTSPTDGRSAPDTFDALVHRQIEARLSRALEDDQVLFQAEREKLDRWAEDQIDAAEKKLDDTKIEIRSAKRDARVAETPADQKTQQEKVRRLERQQRRQRQDIFAVEDAIETRRDQLIDALERKMRTKSTTHHLFTVRWQIA